VRGGKPIQGQPGHEENLAKPGTGELNSRSHKLLNTQIVTENMQIIAVQSDIHVVFAGNKEESGKIQPTHYHTVNYTQSESNQYVSSITDIGQDTVRHGRAQHDKAQHGKVRQSSKNDFADNHIKFQSKSRNYSLASLPHRKNAYLCRDVVGSNEGYRKLKVLFAAPAQVAPGLIDAPDQLTLPDQVTPGFIAAWPD